MYLCVCCSCVHLPIYTGQQKWVENIRARQGANLNFSFNDKCKQRSNIYKTLM